MNKEKILSEAEKYIKENKLDKAIKEYQKIVAEEPADLRVKLKIGDLYARKKDLVRAIKGYREVADAYEKENFHLKAMAVYKTVLKLNPTLIEVNEKLGNLYRLVGLEQDAINQYLIVAGFYDSKGMSKEALAIRKKIVAIDPSSATSRVRLAELYQSEGEEEASVKEYERASDLYKRTNNLQGLVEVYEKVLFYRPNNITMLRALLKIYFEKKDFSKVIKRLEAVPEEVKKDLVLQQLWAETLVEMGQMEAARRRFKDLYKNCVDLKDEERAAQVYARMLREFADDEEYLKEMDQAREEAGFSHPILQASYRADLEGTQMVDLKQLEEMEKRGKKK
ncbi:MAG: tetratricopeptide repeat protein [Deltaproteobacteria bacterium]|nr:tetratricopeptide repeat protein [Deltaproteobacteria bacterium]